MPNIFVTICCKGFLDMAKYLFSYYINSLEDTRPETFGIVNFNDIILEVAKRGHLEMIKYLFELNAKYCKDYFRINHIENTIITALQNNHPSIAEWIIITFISPCTDLTIIPYLKLSTTLDGILKSIFQECIIANHLESIQFIFALYNTETPNSEDLELLSILAKAIFNVYNIRLDLRMMKYVFNTFMTVYDIEKNDNQFMRLVSVDLEKYKNILSRMDTKLKTKEKLEWLSILSDKYEIIFDIENMSFARIIILTPVIIAMRGDNILEACKLLNLTPEYTNQIKILEQWECNICLDNKSHSIITGCNHRFCLPCIYEWIVFNGNKQCPYCRNNVILEDAKYCIAE